MDATYLSEGQRRMIGMPDEVDAGDAGREYVDDTDADEDAVEQVELME
jgi:hypothetical protein